MRRPHRLWVVVLINVALGVLTVALIGLWLIKVNAVHKVTVGIFVRNYAIHILLCAVLIASSMFALLGSGRARWIALATAILFFGFHLIQSVWLYYLSGLALRRDQGLFLTSSVERDRPHLRLVPIQDGLAAIIYFDWDHPELQWRREVPAEEVYDHFERVLLQELKWF